MTSLPHLSCLGLTRPTPLGSAAPPEPGASHIEYIIGEVIMIVGGLVEVARGMNPDEQVLTDRAAR
jgi:hypothetical protein